MGQLAEARFGRVLTAMVTPFTDSGELDLDGTATLARWLVDHGSDGLVVNGTTGESPALSSDETLELFRAVREAVDVPMVAGTGSNDTAHAVRMSEAAAEIGADGLLLVTPYYNRPPQAGIESHFRRVAGSTDLPALIYDIPIRTGRKVDSDVLVRLASEVDQIVGIKDAAGDPGETARVVAECGEGFQCYSGDDSQTLPLLAAGAVGVIGVATHWAGVQMGEMIAAFDAGDIVEARRLNATLLASYAYESSLDAPNPIPAKAMMRTLGLPVGQCRLPMGEAPAGLEDRAKVVYADLDG